MTTARDLSTLKQDQLDAIDASGVSLPFKLVQLRNPVFWVAAWATITGVVRLIGFYQPGLDNYGSALALGTAAFGIYTVIWLAFLHSLDRYTPLPAKLLATGFAWGAVVATTFLALTVNGAVLNLYAKAFGASWSHDWAPGVTAPITEETAKALGLVMLIGLAPRLMRSAFDGFVAGAFIGLGFQVAEDVLYVFQGAGQDFGGNQTADAIQIIGLRSGSGLVSHALYSALVCCGLMWIMGRDPRGRHVLKGLVLIVLGVVTHASWDTAAAVGIRLFGSHGALWVPILVVVGIAIVVVVGHDAAKSERRWAHAILAPEAGSGVISAAELKAATGTRRDRRRFLKSHHRRQRRAAKHVLAAARDLGVTIGREGAHETSDVEHARAEVARLRNA